MGDDRKTTDEELDQRTMGLELDDLSFAEVEGDGRHRTLALDADELRAALGVPDESSSDDDDALVQPTMPMSAGMLAAARDAFNQRPLGDPLDVNTQPLGPDETLASTEGAAVPLPLDPPPKAPAKPREPATSKPVPPAIRGAAIGCVLLAVLTLGALAAAIVLRG